MKRLPILLCMLPLFTVAQDISPQTKSEIPYLLNYLKQSGCQFNRNGTWYAAAEAVDHLNQKYDYLLKKGMLATTEDFITKAASESSMSGKPYHVKCAGAAEVESGPWLRAVLGKYRAGR
ncbi:DUF5329 domain-containing protein [Burkholderiaceae bacterium DAT-1]|nr:DUF5329 domain-containing protein [Burkholderiaceae bacterium DAT-1]